MLPSHASAEACLTGYPMHKLCEVIGCIFFLLCEVTMYDYEVTGCFQSLGKMNELSSKTRELKSTNQRVIECKH